MFRPQVILKPTNLAFLALFATAWVLGLLGLYQRLVFGHQLASYGSYAVWGLWVASYIYFVGLSAGAFLVSSLFYVFKVKALERIGRLSLFVALTTLIMAVLVIWFDIGHMERVSFFFLRPNFTSMMNNMIWMYNAYFLVLLAELILVMGTWPSWGSKLVTILGTIGVPLAVMFHGGVGALFAVVGARPYWYTSIVPILFLAGALLSGSALLTFIVAFLSPNKDGEHKSIVTYLGRLVLALALIYLLLEWSEISVPLWSTWAGSYGGHVESLRLALFGPYWWVFWIVHIGIGMLVPIAVLFFKRDSVKAIGLSSLIIALTFMTTRLNIVIPGLVVAELAGLEAAYFDKRLQFSYVPSFSEWLLVLFVVDVGILLFLLGTRFLPITSSRKLWGERRQ